MKIAYLFFVYNKCKKDIVRQTIKCALAPAAKMMMEKSSARGSYYLCKAVDPDYFMELMAERGITYSTSQD